MARNKWMSNFYGLGKKVKKGFEGLSEWTERYEYEHFEVEEAEREIGGMSQKGGMTWKRD